jgi:hypothetical protein
MMWSDNETIIDLLDFKHLIAAINSIIKEKSLHPATIGVYGDWGSGKSSLMHMVRTAIEKGDDKNIMAIQFNGWLFESYEDAKSALMGTILDEISSKRTLGPKAKGLITTLFRKVDWMRIGLMTSKYYAAHAVAGELGVGIAAASDIPEVVKEIADQLKDVKADDVEKLIKEDKADRAKVRMAIRDFHDDFNDLLNETNINTLVVFIDDLDRCNPGTVIDVFEAIRLFLFVPNSVFVIAADEDLIRFAVSTKFPGFQERSGIGRDYLEKLIQYPIKVPPLGKSEIENYIKLLFVNSSGLNNKQFEEIRSLALERAIDSFQSHCLDYDCIREVIENVPIEIIDGFSLAESLAPIIAVGLSGNPRQTKRFLNMLRMRIEMASTRKITLNIRVLAKLMLLEYFQTENFRQLAELQMLQEGKPGILTILEKERELTSFTRDELKPTEMEHAGAEQPITEPNEANQENQKPSETMSLDEDEVTLVQAWRTDKWMKTWLSLEPTLTGTDLRPYFYFSRDNLAINVSSVRRMSPEAQKILAELLGESEIVRRSSIERSISLSQADVNSLFGSLADRFRNNDDVKIKESILKIMFDFVEKRKESISQICVFLKAIPETMVPIVAVIRLVSLTEGQEEEKVADSLLHIWSTNKINPVLAKAASDTITRKTIKKQ